MRFEPASGLVGSLAPPPDKSISHRAALIAAMSEGETVIRNYLRSEDTSATLAAVHELGTEIVEHQPGAGGGANLVLRGAGLRGAVPDHAIDVGNAGTLLRLLPGWLAGQGRGRWTLDGDESIRRRPVDRVAAPLLAMGARVSCRDGRLPPLELEGAALEGIRYELPVASAQVKSCVLLAGLLASGQTTVVEPLATRDHTERMLAAAGAGVDHNAGSITVSPAERLRLGRVDVPADFSSAAFMLAAATLVAESRVRLTAVGVNPTRTGLLAVLERMGAAVQASAQRDSGGEPIADLEARSASLTATEVSGAEVPSLIDELPLVALLGAFAEGETVVTGAQELRHKESDRIATVTQGLGALGADIEARPDGFAVRGTGDLRGGTLDAAGDHRLAMLGAVAGLASREGVEVRGFDVASVSYPGFAADLSNLLR
jgi:3-phosphoshikimate 1-carboxyvinyltransferase